MEITRVDGNSIRIKGKQAAIGINPTDKNSEIQAAIVVGKSSGVKIPSDIITIDGPGEYEIGGIKISGVPSENETVYYLSVDDVLVLVGTLPALSRIHTKLTESHIVLVDASKSLDASFLTSFTPNVVMLYGEKADEIQKVLAKEGAQKMSKFQTSLEKLPSEMTTILLN